MNKKEFYKLKAENLLRVFQVTYDTMEEYNAQVTLMAFNLQEIAEESRCLRND